MATSTETVHAYPFPVGMVRAALTDPDYLRARLRAVGGSHAELDSYTKADDQITIKLRQQIPADSLPAFAKSLLPAQLVIDRVEKWTTTESGATATIAATVPGTPATIDCLLKLTAAETGSRLTARVQVTVSVPFVGAKIEKTVLEQVVRLFSREQEFTARWLGEQA